MANFEYIARNAEGEQVAGVVQADNEAGVIRALDERQLYPVRVTAKAVVGVKRGGRVRSRDVGVVYGQLSDLLRSGVPLLRSLEILVRAATKPQLAAIVSSVREQVSEGKTLAESMNAHPEVFTNLHTAMVRAGERAGFLEDVLANLAAFLERQDELRGRVRGAMIYPAVLVVIGTLVILAVVIFVVPKFKPLFANIPLPLPSTLVFAFSDLLTDHLALLLGLLVLAVIGGRQVMASQYLRETWERARLRLPVLGRVVRMVCISRFCRILGTMLANGVPLLQALAISKDAAGSTVLAAGIDEAAESVRRGQTLAEPLKKGGLFPPEVVEMIAVAEESNQMEKVLVQIADTVERRTSRQVDQAVRLIEPLILVFMAAVIGFVALGLLYPVFMLSQTLR